MRICGPYTRIKFEEYNLNSHQQLKNFLLTQGWRPTQFNYKLDDEGNRIQTSPKLTEDSFDSIQGNIGKQILERASLKHRREFIQNIEDPENKGLLAYLRPDGRVSADANTVGTPTHRYRHVAPVVNTPSSDAPYGKEVRSLFCAREPYKMVGADFAGIEMRMAAHFAFPFDGGKLKEQVLVGDFHQDVADNVYHCSRKHGKGATYGILYGCGPPKLASYLDVSETQARKILGEFWEYNIGLGKLKEKLEKAYRTNKGWIRGLDGRKIFIRGKHKLLNSLIQSGSAVLFKRWLVNVNKELAKDFFDSHIVIAYHDELQLEVHEYEVDTISVILREQASLLQAHYNLHVPIVADVKVGMNWGETH